jgi:hypothetical protein
MDALDHMLRKDAMELGGFDKAVSVSEALVADE